MNFISGCHPSSYQIPHPGPANFVIVSGSHCKPADSKLFDIRGRNIILLTPGNSAKLRSYQDGESAEAG